MRAPVIPTERPFPLNQKKVHPEHRDKQRQAKTEATIAEYHPLRADEEKRKQKSAVEVGPTFHDHIPKAPLFPLVSVRQIWSQYDAESNVRLFQAEQPAMPM